MSTRFQLRQPENRRCGPRVVNKMEKSNFAGTPRFHQVDEQPGSTAGFRVGHGEHFPLAKAGGVSCSDPLRSSESSHAKDQEVRCETVQSVRPGQAHASLSGNPAPRQSKIPEAKAPAWPGQSPGRRPCRAAQALLAVQLNAPQPPFRQAGDSQGDPPAPTTLPTTCLVPRTPPRRASAARRC